jgi:hypothetical protein
MLRNYPSRFLLFKETMSLGVSSLNRVTPHSNLDAFGMQIKRPVINKVLQGL